MIDLQHTIQRIRPLDEAAMSSVRAGLREKGLEGCGRLEELLVNYAGITGETAPQLPKKCMVVACADHGVAEMKISAYPVETTVQMTKNYLRSKGAVANALANFSGAEMLVVDMGIASPMDDLPGLLNRKIAFGTKNCANGPAMTREEALTAIQTGIEIANLYAARGYRCFLPGEMGIANTTSSAAIVATFCDLTPEQATGRGTNISDERLKVKIEVVRQALAVNRPDPTDGVDVLAKVGGFELGCIAGIILGAAANRAFVVLDGFNTGAAALIAAAICPRVRDYLMGSHLAAEPAHQKTLETLGIRYYMDMQFRLGEATGSSIAVNLLDAMIRAYAAPQTAKTDLLPPPVSTRDIEACAAAIRPLDTAAMEACQLHIDNLTKPIHSLGVLEQLAVKLAGAIGDAKPGFLDKSLLVFDPELANGATAAFAAHAGATLCRYALPASGSIENALGLGLAAAREAYASGSRILGLAARDANREMALQIAAACPDAPSPAEITALLAAHEAAEIAAMTGAIIGAAERRMAVVLDGPASQCAALLAVKRSPQIADYLILPEKPPQDETACIAEKLAVPSYLELDMTIGEGCQSALGMKLIDAALHMLNDMKTFAEAAVAVANDGPGAARQKS